MKGKGFLSIFFSIILCFFPSNNLGGVAHDVQVDNTAKYAGSGRYDWTVYVVAGEDTLKQIKLVEYTLHPTFPVPVHQINTRGTKCPFSFSSNGWGEFSIRVRIVFNDDTVETTNYWLKLFEKSKQNDDRCRETKK